MFLTGVALLMSPSSVLSVSPQQRPSGNEDERIIVLVTSDTFMQHLQVSKSLSHIFVVEILKVIRVKGLCNKFDL